MLNKKIISSLIISSVLALSACEAPNLSDNDLAIQTVNAESISKNNGTVPANGNLNIQIDNETLARRTFNNATPKMHIDGAEAYPAMERVIDNAKESLYVETFIFHDDESGRKIAQKIAKKKKEGLDVRVIIDGLGLKLKKNDIRIYEYLKSEGVNVQIYNKTLLGLHGINITHRKLIIADGEVGVTGGMNFGDEYEKVWHDSMTEFQGEVVQDMQREFLVDWKRAGGNSPKNPPVLKAGKVYGNVPLRVVVTTAHEQKKRYQIQDSTLTLIKNAKKKITFFGAYFSDDKLIDNLVEARKRGIDVELIVPKKGDSKIFDKLNELTAKKMIKSDIKFFFYLPRFSHIKAAIIDDFAVVGSANTDARSFRENQELNVIVEDPAFKQDLENRLVAKDISQSQLQDMEKVKVPFGRKVAQTFLEIVDYYL